jgi:hypothetical protein
MTTLTGRNSRTLTSYVERLLEYPRWVIERDVDFSNCNSQGTVASSDERCRECAFGEACCWLNLARVPTSTDNPLPELENALKTAVSYLKKTYGDDHERACVCETCLWLRSARQFMRSQHDSC